jgi:phage shock protein PspC (stress-responsive transcriptional regulator)
VARLTVEESQVKRLSRPRNGKMIAGVCAGVARYLDIDVTLVRLLWILLTIFPHIPGIIAYVVCWIVMPRDQEPAPPVAAMSQV